MGVARCCGRREPSRSRIPAEVFGKLSPTRWAVCPALFICAYTGSHAKGGRRELGSGCVISVARFSSEAHIDAS